MNEECSLGAHLCARSGFKSDNLFEKYLYPVESEFIFFLHFALASVNTTMTMVEVVLRTTNTIFIVNTNLKNATSFMFEHVKRQTRTQVKPAYLLVIGIFWKKPPLKNLQSVTLTMPSKYQIGNILDMFSNKKLNCFEKDQIDYWFSKS